MLSALLFPNVEWNTSTHPNVFVPAAKLSVTDLNLSPVTYVTGKYPLRNSPLKLDFPYPDDFIPFQYLALE